jgi:Na+-transporting NADH:ubiquinone oxidoreductase subunit NqrA
MWKSIQRLLALLSLSLFINAADAQPATNSFERSFKKESKPFKILTSGKQITVKSTKDIKTIMVWTATGHRIVEQTLVNASSYTFNVSGSRERIFFVMVQYEGQKPVTEKFGVE